MRGKDLGWLFIGALSAGALFGRGTLSSVDEIFIYETTRAIVERGSTQIEWRVDEPPARLVSRFSLVNSLWAAPFFAAASQLASDAPENEAWRVYGTELSSSLATAMTATMLAGWLVRLGFARPIAIRTGWLYAIGSLALAYSSTLFQQVIVGPVLLACCWSASSQRRLATATCFAILVATRMDQLLLAPALVLGLLETCRNSRRGMSIAIALGGICGLAVCLATNYTRGDPLIAGAYEHETFTTPLWIGLSSTLFSFGKGMLWFSPLAATGLMGMFGFAERRPSPGRLIMLVVGTHLAIVSQWWAWHGSWSFGPRLLLPILPLCMMPIADWLSRWTELTASSRRLFLLIAGASVAVGLWSATQPQIAFMSQQQYVDWQENEAFYLPHLGPYGQPMQALASFLWQSQNRHAQFVGLALAGIVLLSLGIAFGGALRSTRLACGKHVVMLAVLAMLGSVPAVIDAAAWVGVGPFRSTQYRNLASADSHLLRGTIHMPLRGLYQFYSDLSQPFALRIRGIDVFGRGASGIISFDESGPAPIEIQGRNGPPGTLRWSIPGHSMYKQAVPHWCLLAPQPTDWERWAIQWRFTNWVLSIPAFLILAHWVVATDSKRADNTGGAA